MSLFMIFVAATAIASAVSGAAGSYDSLALLGMTPDGLSSRGNEFMIGFMPNNYLAVMPRPIAAIFVTTDEPTPVTFIVEADPRFGISTQNRTAEYGRTTVVRFPTGYGSPSGPDIRLRTRSQIRTAFERNKYIRVKAEDGKDITVFGLNDEDVSADAFLALPCQPYDGITTNTPYEYFIFSANVLSPDPNAPVPTFLSGFLIVTCEDDTTITITPSQTIEHDFGAGRTGSGGTLTVLDQQSRQTIYIEAITGKDLTGTIVTSTRPISVFAGHVCGYVPADRTACDHLVEQVPPHVVWGTTFFGVPLARRMAGDRFIVGAIRDNTVINVTCTTPGSTTPRFLTSVTRNRAVTPQGNNYYIFDTPENPPIDRDPNYRADYCCIETNLPVAVMQYSKGHSVDEFPTAADPTGDPFMLVVPPVAQYLNNFVVTTAEEVRTFDCNINIAISTEFFNNTPEDRAAVLINGTQAMPEAGWIPIYCSSGSICGYGAQISTPVGASTLVFNKPSAAMNAYVYGFERESSFAYPAGFEMEPIGFAHVTISPVRILVSEGTETVNLQVTRSGDISLHSRVFYNTRRTSTDDAAATNGSTCGMTVDYVSPSQAVQARDRRRRFIENAVTSRDGNIEITICDDSIEEDPESFEVYITDENFQNAFVFPNHVATVTIVDNDEPPRIWFDPASYTVNEVDGFVEIRIMTNMLNMDGSARFYTEDDTATAADDFTGITITNAVAVNLPPQSLSAVVQVPIRNDTTFEMSEQFFGRLRSSETIAGLIIPVDRATVQILDDDDDVTVEFMSASYSVAESDGFANITVLKQGETAQIVSVEFSTLDGTANDGSDYSSITFNVSFEPSESSRVVSVPIIDDGIFELAEDFHASLSLLSGSDGVVLGAMRATITIIGHVQCFSDAPGSCDGTELSDVSTARECCLGDGYFFNSTHGCLPCIVHGFERTNISAEEGSLEEVVTVRLYLKGNASSDPGPPQCQNFIFNVTCQDISTESSDYNITACNDTIQLGLSSESSDVSVALNNDTVALEGAEVLHLELDLMSPNESNQTCFDRSPNIFFVDEATIEIIDTTELRLGFSQSVYEGTEGPDPPNSPCNVIVEFVTSIANSLTLRFIPQTFDETAAANGSNMNRSRLMTASREDFNDTQPFEATISARMAPLTVSIPTVDDDINELDEDYIVFLEVIEPVTIPVEFSLQNTTCRIRESDPIEIGFRRPNVFHNETRGTFSANIIKLQQSNLTFVVRIQINAPQIQGVGVPATLPSDGNFSVVNSVHCDNEGERDTLCVMLGPDENEGTIEYEIYDDEIPENTELFALYIVTDPEPSYPTFTCMNSCNQELLISIYDDDIVTVGYTHTVVETGEQPATLNVSISSPLNVTLEIVFSLLVNTMDITAGSRPYTDVSRDFIEGSEDFQQVFDNLPSGNGLPFSFQNSRRWQIFLVNIFNDNIPEGVEDFNVTLSLVDATGILGSNVRVHPATATVRIQYNDFNDSETVGLLLMPTIYQVNEGAGNVSITFQVFDNTTTSGSLQVTLGVEFIDVSATGGEDYVIQSDFILELDNSIASIQIELIDDSVVESSEILRGRINVPQSDVLLLGTEREFSVTILDDDSVTVRFETTDYTVAENRSDGVNVVVAKTGSNNIPVLVYVRTLNGSADSTDFTPVYQNLTFSPEDTQQNISVDIQDDDITEGNETFTITLSTIPFDEDQSAVAQIQQVVLETSFSTVTINIVDDDVLEVRFDGMECIGREDAEEVMITIDLTRETSLNLSFNISTWTYSTYNETYGILPGFLSCDILDADRSDLTMSSSLVTRNTSIAIPFQDDDINESDEVFYVSLMVVGDYNNTLVQIDRDSMLPKMCRIRDNDVMLIGFAQRNYTFTENDTTMMINLTTNRQSQQTFRIQLIQGSTRCRGCVLTGEGDLSTVPLSISTVIQPGEQEKSIEITSNIIDDSIPEYTESFTLSIQNEDRLPVFQQCDQGSCYQRTTVSIIDNDVITVGFNQTSHTVVEGGEVTVCVGIMEPKNTSIEVTFNLVVVTERGTAFGSSVDCRNDYRSVNTTISFSHENGTSQQCLNVKTCNDSNNEEMEEFNVTLSVASGEILPRIVVDANASMATVFIQDDDEITAGFEASLFEVSEGIGCIQLCVNVSMDENIIISDQLALRLELTNTTTEDINLPVHNISLNPNDTAHCIAVNIVDDEIPEKYESFLITLSLLGDGAVAINPRQAIIVVQDNDPLTVGFDNVSYTVSESDGSLPVCVTIHEPTNTSFELEFNLSVKPRNDTAKFGEDYNVMEDQLSFNGTQQLQCFNIFIMDDSDVEGTETFNISVVHDHALSLSTNQILIDPNTAVFTILDDDRDTTASLSLTNSAVTGSGPTSSPTPQNDLQTILLAVLVPAAVLIVLIVVVGAVVMYLRMRSASKFTPRRELPSEEDKTIYADTPGRLQRPSVQLRKLLPHRMIVPSSVLHLHDTIGQGEFGVVYKAHLQWYKDGVTEVVAVKTLKGLFSATDVSNLVQEVHSMYKLSHRNVMSLTGVCVDASGGPAIVMPYMANGSVLHYLKKEREKLVIPEDADPRVVSSAQTFLLDVCLQISRGMEYLVKQKIIHRDLSARNCMIDANGVIKVADFGLAEDIYTRNYYRRRKSDTSAKLPVRWMSPESIEDGIFTEKSDVWSFGVTCWEVFSGGMTPYSGISPMALFQLLSNGERLQKPMNSACSDEIFAVMLQCWEADPNERPHFTSLVVTISTTLEVIAGYLDLCATSLNLHCLTTEADIVTVVSNAEPQVEEDGFQLEAKETAV